MRQRSATGAKRCAGASLLNYWDHIMPQEYSRRQWLAATSVAGAGLLAQSAAAAEPAMSTFRFCLNTSTLMGQKLDIVELVEIAAKAGYQAIEPWIRELDEHVKKGGSLRDLGQRIKDR